MSSTTPSGNPRNPAGLGLSETPIQARKIATLPRHVREKQLLDQDLARGNSALVLNPFRSLVASPATPNTPTPVPQLGFGYTYAPFIPSPLRGSTTPEHSFSSFSTPSPSPSDTPYPSTPIPSPFDPDPSVVAGNQDDADPFEILEKVYDIEKTLAVVVPPVPLKHGSQRTDLQESPSPLNSAEGTGYSSQRGADITLGLRRSARHLERRFTRGALLSFHDPPGQYTLAQRVGTLNLDNGAPNVVSVLRNSPQIFEEDIPDEEAEPENRDDDDAAPYSFPCEDPKINELVSKMTSLSLGTSLSISRSTVTPTRVRARVPAFTPVCAQASSVVAVLRPVESRPPTVQRATPMDVDEDVLYPKVVNKGAPHPEKILEAVLMDGVVFHPEVKDVEMSEAFATNPGAAPLTSPTLVFTSTGPAFSRPQSTFETTRNPKSMPHQTQRTVSRALPPPSQQSRAPERTVFDFLCQPPKSTILCRPATIPPTSAGGRSLNSCAR